MSRCPTCEKNARRERAEARLNGELDPEAAVLARNGRVVHFTEEERQRRSTLAKKLHAEGRFGGAVVGRGGGHAIQRHRIADAVLEHFRQPELQAKVISAYESNLKGKNKTARMAAADRILRLEKEADERLARDRGGAVDPYSMTQEELQAFVMQGLEGMIARGEIEPDVVLGGDSVEVVLDAPAEQT
jgi:hypothetical protein